MNVESNKYQLIPAGDSKQEIKARELIISEVFRKWYEANPSKSIYNQNLRDNIYIRFLSINETIHHASRSYHSTLAVLKLDYLLKNAYQIGKPVKVKINNKNQTDFARILILQCPLCGVGIAKITVGVKKKTGAKILYCITAKSQ